MSERSAPSRKTRESSESTAARGGAADQACTLHRSIGNQAVQQLVGAGRKVLSKFAVGRSDDPLESEADRVAAQVMRSEPGVAAPNHASDHSRTANQNAGGASDSLQEVLHSSGRPLDAKERSFMEPRFGRDFGQVRIHTGDAASRSAEELMARAYTTNSSIAFRQGAYSPNTADGRRLLAHELAHVVQQSETGATGAVQRDAAAPDAATNLDQEYQTAVQMGDWQAAAEWLNGFNRQDIDDRLVKLTPEQIAQIHQGALDNPRVGPESQVALMTAPGTPPASVPPAAVPSSPAPAAQDTQGKPGPPQLVQSFWGWVAERNWPQAAETLNGFEVSDMRTLLSQCSAEQIASIHQGALDNPRVGPNSQVALWTAPGPASVPEPMGGGYEDYKSDPDYLDNFDGAAYDPSSKTVHLFFADNSEAIVTLPLKSSPVLVFQRMSLLQNPGPTDYKIYPSLQDKTRLPGLTAWLAEHQQEMEQSDALLQAGTLTLQARSVPPDLWWLALAAPAAGLGARFSAMRMRPSFGTVPEEPGEVPIIRTPVPQGGPPTPTVPEEPGEIKPPSSQSPAVTPGSGYATSVGELKEPPVLTAIPGARSATAKFTAYDGFTPGQQTEWLTKESNKSGETYTVVNQSIKGGTWISIISPESATEESVARAVRVKIGSAYNAEQNPSSRLPSVDPEPIDTNTKYRLIKDGPADAVTIVVNVGPVSPELLDKLQQAADQAAKSTPGAEELPNLKVEVTVGG